MASGASKPPDWVSDLSTELKDQFRKDGNILTGASYRMLSLCYMCFRVYPPATSDTSKTLEEALDEMFATPSLWEMIDIEQGHRHHDGDADSKKKVELLSAQEKLSQDFICRIINSDMPHLDKAKKAFEHSLDYLFLRLKHVPKVDWGRDLHTLLKEVITTLKLCHQYADYATKLLAIHRKEGMVLLQTTYREKLENYRHDDPIKEFLRGMLERTLAARVMAVLGDILQDKKPEEITESNWDYYQSKIKDTLSNWATEIGNALADTEQVALSVNWIDVSHNTFIIGEDAKKRKMINILWDNFTNHTLKIAWLVAQLLELRGERNAAMHCWKKIGRYFFDAKKYSDALPYLVRALSLQKNPVGYRHESPLIKQVEKCYNTKGMEAPTDSKNCPVPPDPLPEWGI